MATMNGWLKAAALSLDDERADRETAGCFILGRDRDPADVADIEWAAALRLGRLEVGVRLHVAERDPDALPDVFLQIDPARIDDPVAIEERDREPQRVPRLDLERNRASAAPIPDLGVVPHVASGRVAGRRWIVDDQDRVVWHG